jgi:hypothetical protein
VQRDQHHGADERKTFRSSELEWRGAGHGGKEVAAEVVLCDPRRSQS